MSDQLRFSVATGNVLHGPYGFMWNNACALNDKGKEFMSKLQNTMDLLNSAGKTQEARTLGAETVKKMVASGEYKEYSSSPDREAMIKQTMTDLIKSGRSNLVVGNNIYLIFF